MLPNLLIALGIVLIASGAWLKFREQPTPAPVEVAKAAPASPEEKGLAFEQWVVSHLSKQHHVVKDWRSDKKAPNGTYAESNQYPDVEVALHLHGKEYPFAMECKWRNSFMGASVELDKDQVTRYQSYEAENQLPVFLVLGIGGQPDKPAELYIIPARQLSTKLSMDQLGQYRQPMTRSTFYFDAFTRKLGY